MPDGATLILVNWLIFSKICVFSVDYHRKKIGDNPHGESNSIGDQCVTKLALASSRPTTGQNSSIFFTK